MERKHHRILAAVLSAAITISLGTSIGTFGAYAETASSGNGQAVLSYNDETGDFELKDMDGNIIDAGYDDTESYYSGDTTYTTVVTGKSVKSDDETVLVTPAETTAPQVTEQTYTTIVVVKTPEKTTTRFEYIGRSREEAEKSGKLVTNPVTTTKKTTTTTKKTTTTTKKVSTTTKSIYRGIDVSGFQGNIDWKKVKAAGIDFVIIKAGYGKEADQVDSKFHTNVKNAQAAGVDCGVYWYSYAKSTADALREAKTCYNTIKGYKFSYPVAFDIEDPSQTSLSATTISNIIKVFGNYLEDLNYYVSVYSYASFLKDKCNGSVYSSFDIWVAHINVSKPSFSQNYGMWQYSHTGKVSGISGNVDLDYSYKYYPDIMKKNKLNGYK